MRVNDKLDHESSSRIAFTCHTNRTIMTTASTIAEEAFSQAEFKDRIKTFVRAASIEVTPHDEDLLPQLPHHLPAGTTVYIGHPPRRHLRDIVRVADQVRKLGFNAVPHILARELESERHLRGALDQLRASGIDHILLIAGDQLTPAGPFASTLNVLATNATVDYGMKTVAVAGHPEGHKVVGPSLLWDALLAKQAFGERTGTHVHVVTQFGFNPEAITSWRRHCQELGITLPVHVGLAGPTPLRKLIRFAMQCGIGASLNSLMKSTSALSHLARVTSTPEEMLVALVRRPAANIVKPHFYCFGGSLETARWMRSVIDGAFELSGDCSRFVVQDG